MGTFVGIGFGPIQGGLFFVEAAQSGAFDRLVASEILVDAVQSVAAAGEYSVNIAHADRVEVVTIAPVTLYDPHDPASFAALVDAIAEAAAVATALPSVATYSESSGLDAPDRLLAAGLQRKLSIGGPPVIIYTAENNNHAAELLESAVRAWIPAAEQAAVLARVAFVNTVISKMSGYGEPARSKQVLARIAPGYEKAFLVETFNDILISRIAFSDPDATATFAPGITRFREKADLFPFEEAKLFCHNGMHAYAAYLGIIAGCTSMAQLRHVPGILSLVRAATCEEPGLALVRKYQHVDPLFTEAGISAFVDNYLERMVNPLLDDDIKRVARDPQRKLAWGDRLIGAMRLALAQGILPRRFALGAAAALANLVADAAERSGAFPWGVLPALWQRPVGESSQVEEIETLIANAWTHLEAFRGASSDTPVAPAQGAVASNAHPVANAQPVAGAQLAAGTQPGTGSQTEAGAQATEESAPAALDDVPAIPAKKGWGEDAPVYYRPTSDSHTSSQETPP